MIITIIITILNGILRNKQNGCNRKCKGTTHPFMLEKTARGKEQTLTCHESIVIRRKMGFHVLGLWNLGIYLLLHRMLKDYLENIR